MNAGSECEVSSWCCSTGSPDLAAHRSLMLQELTVQDFLLPAPAQIFWGAEINFLFLFVINTTCAEQTVAVLIVPHS